MSDIKRLSFKFAMDILMSDNENKAVENFEKELENLLNQGDISLTQYNQIIDDVISIISRKDSFVNSTYEKRSLFGEAYDYSRPLAFSRSGAKTEELLAKVKRIKKTSRGR